VPSRLRILRAYSGARRPSMRSWADAKPKLRRRVPSPHTRDRETSLTPPRSLARRRAARQRWRRQLCRPYRARFRLTPVVGMRSFFAMAASRWSRTSRPWRWWRCYCILVDGAACTALRSELAYRRMAMERAWRGPGCAGRVARRARQAPSLQGELKWSQPSRFHTLARRESCSIDGGELSSTSDDAKSSQLAHKTVTG